MKDDLSTLTSISLTGSTTSSRVADRTPSEFRLRESAAMSTHFICTSLNNTLRDTKSTSEL